MGGLRLEFGASPWLWLLVPAAAAAAFALYRPVFGALPRRRAAALAALRVSAAALLALFALDPVLSWTGLSGENSVAVLVDSSMSMGVADQAGGRTRLAAARDALLSGEKPLLPGLESLAQVRMYAFGSGVRPIGGPEALAGLEPEDESTDLAGAISAAHEQAGPGGNAAVLVISDGVDTAGADAQAGGPGRSAPVLALAIGGDPGRIGGLRDLAVSKVVGGDSVFLGQTHEITVRVEAAGIRLQEVPVTVSRGVREAASGRAVFGEGRSWAETVLRFAPDEKGLLDYTISVPVQEGESITGNNVLVFPLEVHTGRIPVLYVEGSLRWEYKYLKSTLFEDPNVECTALIRTSPGVFTQQGKGRPMLSEGRLLFDRDSLAGFAAVIIGDLEASAFSADQKEALVWFVSEKGGGLVMLGGTGSIAGGSWAGTAVEEAMPVWMGAVSRPLFKGSVSAALTPDGAGHPVFSGYESFFAEGSELPALDGVFVTPGLKPGASVLAVCRETGDPLVAAQRFGSGRSVAVLADTLWKWYLKLKGLGKDSPYSRFWMQMLRWIAGDAQEAGDRSPIQLRTDKRTYRVGEAARADVIARKLPGEPDLAGPPVLEVIDPRGRSAVVDLDPRPPIYGGRFEIRMSGEYRLRASVRSTDGKAFEKALSVSAGGRGAEFDRLAWDPGRLRGIASATGGGFFTLPEASAIPGRVREILVERGDRRETGPSKAPWFFLVLLGLLSAEWILRRRSMLV